MYSCSVNSCQQLLAVMWPVSPLEGGIQFWCRIKCPFAFVLSRKERPNVTPAVCRRRRDPCSQKMILLISARSSTWRACHCPKVAPIKRNQLEGQRKLMRKLARPWQLASSKRWTNTTDNRVTHVRPTVLRLAFQLLHDYLLCQACKHRFICNLRGTKSTWIFVFVFQVFT